MLRDARTAGLTGRAAAFQETANGDSGPFLPPHRDPLDLRLRDLLGQRRGSGGALGGGGAGAGAGPGVGSTVAGDGPELAAGVRGGGGGVTGVKIGGGLCRRPFRRPEAAPLTRLGHGTRRTPTFLFFVPRTAPVRGSGGGFRSVS